MDRYQWLESQLDREDLTPEEFNSYNNELNLLEEEKAIRKNKQKLSREQQLKKEQEEKELEFIQSLTDDQVDIMYEKAHIKYASDINGMSFDEWFKQALTYYFIDGNFVVHSTARSPKPEKIDSVPCYSEAHAKYRVLKLILTKLNDHGSRGYDFRWESL
jgi:hypothetical protein